MHGLVAMELKKHVEQQWGAATWSSLLVAAGLPGRVYSASGTCPDEELVALVDAAASATGATPGQVLERFGRFLAPDLVTTYHFLVREQWTAFDLVEHTEATIHTVVRARDASATPPVLHVHRLGPQHLTVRYGSARRLCALARGILLGLGDHFGTPLQVREELCALAGAPTCLLDVSAVPALPAPRQAAPTTQGAALP